MGNRLLDVICWVIAIFWLFGIGIKAFREGVWEATRK